MQGFWPKSRKQEEERETQKENLVSLNVYFVRVEH
jgi:hypothetical protein